VSGCLLASYITFDLSPELALKRPAQRSEIDAALSARVRARVAAAGLSPRARDLRSPHRTVWPAMQKMKRATRNTARPGSGPSRPRWAGATCASSRSTSCPASPTPGDDRRHAGALRGARDAGQFHRAGIRLPEEHALSGQRGAAPPGRAAVGGRPAVWRRHRVPLGLGQVGGELPRHGRGDRRAPRDQDERPLHLRDGGRPLSIAGSL
jgi:hypothetical protein